MLALAAGGLSTLSPCVFPLLPLVAGGSLQAHRAGPVFMGLGMMSSFALIGLLLGSAGPALGIDNESIRSAGGALLLLLGAVMLMLYSLSRIARFAGETVNTGPMDFDPSVPVPEEAAPAGTPASTGRTH